MSTYTDLHNKVKESLNVDYHSRETNQKTLFLNPENEYWGTFHGEVDVKGASINGGVLSGVTIYGANLLCSSLDNVDVTTFGKLITNLSVFTHNELISKIDTEDTRLQTEIDKEVTARKNAISNLSSNLSIAVNGKYNAMLSAFDAEVEARKHGDDDSRELINSTSSQILVELGNEVNARISAINDEISVRTLEDAKLWTEAARLSAEDARLSGVDYKLSCDIIDTNLSVKAEVNARADADASLDFRIDNVDNYSEARYLSALSALDEHAKLNDFQFETLSACIDNKVEHDKHYTIVESSLIQATYPYILKDFAINRLEVSAIDGYAYHNHGGTDINVGMLVCENSDDRAPLTLFGIQHKDPVVFNALNPNVDITLAEYGKLYDQGPGSGRQYKIKITAGAEFEDNYFTLSRDGDTYLPVKYNGKTIALIHDATPSTLSSGNIIKKGLLTVTSLDTDISPWKHIVWNFNVDAGEVEHIEDEVCIKYNGDNTFSFGYNPVKCQYICDDTYEFAKVYDGGIVRNDALVKNVHVKLETVDIIDRADGEIKTKEFNRYFDLSSTTDYTVEIDPCVYFKCAFNEDYTAYKFTVSEKTEFLKYNLKLSSDEALSGQTVAYVTVGTPNEGIEENTFSRLSVDFSAGLVPGLLPAIFEKVYVLTKDKTVPTLLWKDTYTDEASHDLILVTYDGAAIHVKMLRNVSEGVTYIKFLVDVNSPAVGVDYSRIAYDSGMMPIDTRAATEWTYLGNTVAVIQESTTEEADTIILNIKKNASNEAVFVIPDRTAEDKDYSREMLLVVKFMCPDETRKINLKFIDPRNQPVKYFYDKKPEILVDVNKYTTIKITEVGNGRFLITDWNETEIREKLKTFDKKIADAVELLSGDYTELISAETTNRISADEVLSTAISGESYLRKTADDKLSADINTLNENITNILDTIRGGINYKGIVNVIDTDKVELGSFSLLCGNFHISSLFFVDFGTAVSSGVDPTDYYNKPNAEYTADTVLSNGFMYYIHKTNKNLTDQWVVDGVEIDDKDYIIINCRPNECKKIKDITSADIDVIDAFDSNVFTVEDAAALSNNLCADYTGKITTAKGEAIETAGINATTYTNSISGALSTDYVEKDRIVLISANYYADTLSNRLSIDYDTKVNYLSNALSTYEETTDTSISLISSTVSALIERDKKDMTFLGDVNLADTYTDPEGEAIINNTLYGLMLTNAHPDGRERKLHVGFVFKATAADNLKNFTITDGEATDILHNNDYIIVTKEVAAIKNIKLSDIHVIKSYDAEITSIANVLLGETTTRSNADKSLSAALSGEIIERNTDDQYLSGQVSALQDNVSTIFDSIRGGVNYKGHLNLKTGVYTPGLPLSALFGLYYNVIGPDKHTYLENKKLENGWLYNITLADKYVTGDDPAIELENNDYLIIHDHNLSAVDISSITRDNVDIIEAVQDDYVRLNKLELISNDIQTNLNTASVELSTAINTTSVELSGTINDVSVLLSGAINTTSVALSTAINTTSSELSNAIISNENDIVAVSAHLSDFEDNHYFRTFEKDHSIIAGGAAVSVDLLRLTDETDANISYVLCLEDGVMMLKPKNTYEQKVFNYSTSDFDGSTKITRATYNFGEVFGDELPAKFKLNSLTVRAHINASTDCNDVFLAISENDNTTIPPKVSRNCISEASTDDVNKLITWNFDNLIIDKSKTYMLRFVDSQSAQSAVSAKVSRNIETATTWWLNVSGSGEGEHPTYRLYVSSIIILEV